MLPSLTLHSVSIGLMKGEPRMVCVLIMWSSRSTWMSSTADTILVPYNRRLSIDVNALYDNARAATLTTCRQDVFLLKKLLWQYSSDCAMSMCFSYCISVLSEREPELSPFILHFLHGFFQWVLFTGRSSNLFQPRVKVKKKSITSWSWGIFP